MDTARSSGVWGTNSMASGLGQLLAEAGFYLLLYLDSAATQDFAARMISEGREKEELVQQPPAWRWPHCGSCRRRPTSAREVS